MRGAYRISERRACQVLKVWRSVQRYQPILEAREPVILHRMTEIAQTRVRYGYRRLHVLLAREGWQINHKRLYRLYQQAGLNLRLKRPRRFLMCRASRGARTTHSGQPRLGVCYRLRRIIQWETLQNLDLDRQLYAGMFGDLC